MHKNLYFEGKTEEYSTKYYKSKVDDAEAIIFWS